MKIQRMMALVILVVPGAIGVYGWKLMRDATFHSLVEPNFQWLLFLAGLILFLSGVAFIAGFVFYRDRKRRRVQPRFLNDIDDD